MLIILCYSVQFTSAQTDLVRVGGVVTGPDGPVSGVTISIKDNRSLGVTNEKGEYSFEVPRSSVLVYSHMTHLTTEIRVTGYTQNSAGIYVIDVSMAEREGQEIEETVVVGYGATQRRGSVISSVTTIDPKELRGPTSNLTTMMAGRISGMIAYQRSGEPGADNADFFIRGLGSFGAGKVDPLILIDNVESTPTDLARLQPDDIAKFSVLKDATAAAVYGARGANGVVLVETKSGEQGETRFMFRADGRISTNTRNIQLTDNITYMNLANEAVLTRDLPKPTPYTQSKIENTLRGNNPYLYPNNDWIDMLVRDHTLNQAYNLNVSGGGNRARFYVSGNYTVDNGMLQRHGDNNFNNNIKLVSYALRTAVTLDLTPTTVATARLVGQFDDYNGPIGSGADYFRMALWSNPVQFPAYYPKEYLPYMQHVLFGGYATFDGAPTGQLLTNPYAELVKGYQEHGRSNLNPQVEIRQNLDFLTEGLNFRAMGYVRRTSFGSVNRAYTPFFYDARIDPASNQIELSVINDGQAGSVGAVGQEFLGYGIGGTPEINSTMHFESSLNYARSFGRHNVSGMLITMFQDNKNNFGLVSSLQLGLPRRNSGVSGRMEYGFDDRYLASFNFGYNGSERFDRSRRFGFFPSFGLAYRISNEKFFEPLKPVISDLKFRGTYGIVGNDAIGEQNDRFFYLSDVNLNNGGMGASFGYNNGYGRPGISINRYPNPNIAWMISRQYNLGIDLSMFNNRFNLVAEIYKNYNENILENRSAIPPTTGLMPPPQDYAPPQSNTGKTEMRGIDLLLEYNQSTMSGWFFSYRANMTFAQSKITKIDELLYPAHMSYRQRLGHPITQPFGLVAERLFIDENDLANAPSQQFGEYMAGDIKYRDMNGDELITGNDAIPIGFPSSPELIYGFGGTTGYKSFDFSFFFQGSGQSSFFINPENISPFVRNGGAQNGLLQAVADDHWSEENRNLYAFFPRLSDYFISNNNQTSTWWMRNGEFLRLKNIEFGYTAPPEFTERFRVRSLRLYASMQNVFAISNFKMWDVEMGGNGLGYPLQRVINFGIHANF